MTTATITPRTQATYSVYTFQILKTSKDGVKLMVIEYACCCRCFRSFYF
jgi:hypothetical protein